MKKSCLFILIILSVALITVAGCGEAGSVSSDTSGNQKILGDAPDFSTTSLSGEVISLSDYAGKPIVLNFGASWCGYCEAEAPALAKMYEEYNDRVVFLGLAVRDSLSSQRAFAEKHGLNFPIGFDPEEEIAYSYGQASDLYGFGYPTTFFINKEGKITEFWMGPISESSFKKKVASIIDS